MDEAHTGGTEAGPPSLPWLHGTLLLTGLGTVLLGPILPILSRQWHLQDSGSGLLILSQFCGSFLGGVSTSGRLRLGLMVGVVAAAVGMAVFALAPGLSVACAGLVVGGFGVGRTITAGNILAGRRFAEHRGSELARLNFSWSLGALLSPLLAAWVAPHVPLRNLLVGFAILFVLSALTLGNDLRKAPQEESVQGGGSEDSGMSLRIFLYFAGILLLYGGLETCISGWLTTYALRYGTSSLVLSEYTTVLLLVGLTVGRAVSAALLLRIGEARLVRIALLLSTLTAGGLAMAHTAAAIATCAVLLGLCLAPVFPAAFALAIGFRPAARQASFIMAASALGAAALPALMGLVSTRTGSLQAALVIPVATALALLLLAMLRVSGSLRAEGTSST